MVNILLLRWTMAAIHIRTSPTPTNIQTNTSDITAPNDTMFTDMLHDITYIGVCSKSVWMWIKSGSV